MRLDPVEAAQPSAVRPTATHGVSVGGTAVEQEGDRLGLARDRRLHQRGATAPARPL